MAAFNGGLDVRVFSDLYTTYRSFRTVAEAEAFDYEAEYGELCTHKIESSSAVSVAEGADLTGEDSEAESFGEHRIAVQIQAYNSIVDQHISLENYYDQKVLGTEIYAVNAQLEEKLMKGLDITIRAEHTELMQCRLQIYLPETLEVRDSIRADYTVFHSLFRRGEGSVVLMFVFMVLAVLVCIVMCSAAGYTDDSGVIRANRIHGIFYELFWLLPAVLLLGSYAMVQILFDVNSSYRMIAIFCVGMILMLAVSCVLWLYTTSIRAKNGTFWSSFGTYRLFRFIFSLFSNATAATFGTVAYSIFRQPSVPVRDPFH